jgi:hypothetical protein
VIWADSGMEVAVALCPRRKSERSMEGASFVWDELQRRKPMVGIPFIWPQREQSGWKGGGHRRLGGL